jgi:hypothetical protein
MGGAPFGQKERAAAETRRPIEVEEEKVKGGVRPLTAAD